MFPILLLLGIGGLIASGRALGGPPRALTTGERTRVGLLVPSAQDALEKLRVTLAARGLQIFVGQTWHSADKSAQGFAEGRSATTMDWHRTGRAVDLRVMVNGHQDLQVTRPDLYAIMGKTARAQGWRWLGLGVITNPINGKSFTDPYHIEWHEGLPYAQALIDYERTRVT